jgi:conjugal transfer pilus assembly protein TraD
MHNLINNKLLAAASSHHKHHHTRTTTTDDPSAGFGSADPGGFKELGHAITYLSGSLILAGILGALLGTLIHHRGRLRPEVGATIAAIAAGPISGGLGVILGHPKTGLIAAVGFVAATFAIGFRWDQADRRAGKDRRRRAEDRLGFLGLWRARRTAKVIETAQPAHHEVIVGHAPTRVVKLERGWTSGRHTGVLGAPGSGKSTTIATLLEQHVTGWHELHHGAVIIDPKGDPAIRTAARAAAEAAGTPFYEFSPQGGLVYDVLAGGDVDRRTDKILAAEEWTEPHYLAGATTYLREVMRTLEATDTHPTLTMVLELMDPDKHENHAAAAGPKYAKQLGDYIKSLTPRQRGDLSGLRDRIAALGRSDMAQWLDPDRRPFEPRLDLGEAVRSSAVVLFTLQADDYPLLSKKLAAAIVLDLIAIAQARQVRPIPTFVAIDEFGAIESELVMRLLSRARGAGFSVCLAAQTLADFSVTSPELASRVIGNLNALVVGRMNDAIEAEWVAKVGGTKDSWTTTQRTNLILPANEGTRTLDRDFIVHPDQIKTLRRGEAAVITLDPLPGQRRVEITRVRTPRLA